MDASPFAQPAPYTDDVADIPGQRQAPADGLASNRISYLASYALTLTDSGREAVRNSIAETDLPAYDLALSIQQMRGEGEVADRRRRMLDDEVEKLEVREEARQKHAQAKAEALTNEDAYAAAAARFQARVMGSAALDGIEIPPALVENYLDRNSMARLYGPSGSKKSFAVLDMAACVASGREWHGNATHKAKTLYIVAEGATGILKRVRAWEQAHGQRMEVDFFPEAVQIADEGSMRELVAFAKIGGYEFVIFDTQARCTVGIDENDNSKMGEIVAALDILKQKTGACVLLVHHSGNEGGRGRGATAVLGAMDAEFEVVCKNRGMIVDVLTRKRKDGREMGGLAIEMDELHVTTPRGTETSLTAKPGVALSDDAAAVAAPKVSELMAWTLKCLNEYETATPGLLREDMGIDYKERGKVAQYLKSLKDKGCVETVGTGQWRITETGKRVLNVRGLASQGHQEALCDDEGDE